MRYWLFIIQQHGETSQDIRQYVIYVGKAPMDMPSALVYDRLQFTYPLIDMRSVPATSFLSSDKPVEIILAVLCAYQNQDLLVEKILQRLKNTVVEGLRLSKYVNPSHVLPNRGFSLRAGLLRYRPQSWLRRHRRSH